MTITPLPPYYDIILYMTMTLLPPLLPYMTIILLHTIL